MLKIAVVTSTRAEYGLLRPLLIKMVEEENINMHLLVSGTHLLEKYGRTIDYIIQDNIPIAYEIPMFDESYISDEKHAIEAVSKTLNYCADIFDREKYDALVVLGDRYELLGFCTAAVIARVPIVHIHGGEITEGAIDDKIRHAVTKMSSIHFPSVSEYANRIIQMGEDPKYVYTVGALGIDNIMNLPLLEKTALLNDIGVRTSRKIAAVTFHPVTGDAPESALQEVEEVLDALLEERLFSVVTMPNSDVGGDAIYEAIIKKCEKNPEYFVLKKSLGQIRYLSLLKCADIMVGNSSSGILESASFSLPTIDIGDRQKGRMAPGNVIHCNCEKDEIKRAIERALSTTFSLSLVDFNNPYGDGKTAERIIDIIRDLDFHAKELICKKFIDIG